jgi:hypothetical protein
MSDRSDQRRLDELLDACRPDSGDLQRPEMRALRERMAQDPAWQAIFDRSQALDRQIRTAMQEVPIPEGLEQQLLASLGLVPAVASESSVEPAGTPSPPPARRGRWWQTVALAVALSLALGVAWRPWWSSEPRFRSEQQLLDQALSWALAVDAAQWQDLGESAWANSRWQALPVGDFSVICYEIPGPPQAQERALIFQLPSSAAPVEAWRPPRLPTHSTQGRHFAAWKSDRHLYVLVVEGSKQSFQRLVGPPGSMAHARRTSPTCLTDTA